MSCATAAITLRAPRAGAADTRGYAAYKVGSNVTSHEAWGLVSTATGVRFHHMVTVSHGGTGTISRVVNNKGGCPIPAIMWRTS
ncbi:hypothetical protein GA0115260_120152 [Streptomyces sp. MnatMP-M27]|uniref:hypothetical protein n=1 Tax=Streptomyces sp. MnatMP-M27 TaxID=1839768 RepID=UPI00081F6EDA|nr:hypothetical protein GA0115260_120152 [Streptomyces sp. MnatMP-M27]